MDIRRFGPGNRRPEGPPGTQGITGQVIWNDARGHISELAFSRQALIAPHANPNTTLFIVVSGGGWVQVGDERSQDVVRRRYGLIDGRQAKLADIAAIWGITAERVRQIERHAITKLRGDSEAA